MAFLVVPASKVFSENLQQIQQKLNTISEQRQVLEGEIDGYNKQLAFLTAELQKTQKQIEENEATLARIQAELDIQNGYLAENLRIMYEDGQQSFMELLFSSKSLTEFLNESEYLEITRQGLKDGSDKIQALKDEAEARKQALNELSEMHRVLAASLDKQRAEKAQVLAGVITEEAKIREAFSRRLLAAGKNPYCKGQGTLIRAKYSVFSFPVECGYISQGYGMTAFASVDRAYNGNPHNGFDVGINTGTRILSVGKGTVYARGTSPSGGWGNWVMVKQDKVRINGRDTEFYALYAHMVAESHLKPGQRVNTGDVMGFVGGTPYWAPHLHFSLFNSSSGWQGQTPGPYPGNTVDPLNYMDIPISVGGTDWDPAYIHI